MAIKIDIFCTVIFRLPCDTFPSQLGTLTGVLKILDKKINKNDIALQTGLSNDRADRPDVTGDTGHTTVTNHTLCLPCCCA